ncbi:resolvase [Candidatus Entotheonella serta]|nr:resolvase [Candidatus Entotheonella serta]
MPRKHSQTIGYLRVSTRDQDSEKNKDDILMLAHRQGLGPVQFVEEQASGKLPWHKRQIANVLETLRKDDTLIVSELFQLGRNMLECTEILSLVIQESIRVHAVKGNWQLGGSIQSKITAMAFAMAAEIEYDLISQRTKEALHARKAAGVKLGRPRGPNKSRLDAYQPETEALLPRGSTQKFISQRYGVMEATVLRWRKKRNL